MIIVETMKWKTITNNLLPLHSFLIQKKNLSFQWKRIIWGTPIQYHNDKSRIISILIFLLLLFGTLNSWLILLHKHITDCDKLNLSCTVFLLSKCSSYGLCTIIQILSSRTLLTPLKELWGESFTSSASET